jgi:porphyrinogen peroxidase
VIEDENGDEQDIMRFNLPFGTVGTREFGTFFIGYAKDPAVIEQMLQNMFCGTEDAAHDRILDFSTAITGNLFAVPTVDWLEDPPTPPTPPAANAAGDADADRSAAPAPSPDGSLGVGSLRPD